MLRKTVIFAHKSVDRIVAVISLILFLICLYAMVDAYMVYAGASDTSILRYKPELGDTQALQELSDDAVAWLTVDNTKIDYPVMQGKTNEEYLNKDPYGNYSLAGSIFLDSRNNRNFTDAYSLVYGHHMEYGAMFGALDDYVGREYFDTHKTGELTVVNGRRYSISFFAVCKAQATEGVVFNPTESSRKKLLGFLKKNAVIYEPQQASEGARIIALSTCQSAENVERIIVFGTLEEIN